MNYKFIIKSVINKSTNASVAFSIQPNEVNSECCTNILAVKTKLKFCKTFECD